MSSGLEFEGKNVEDAARSASEKLMVPREKLKFDVISYGSSGIFGLVGTKKARIRVAMPAASAATAEPEKIQARESIAEREIGEEIEEREVEEEREEGEEDEEAIGEEAIPTVPEELIETGKAAIQTIVDAITENARVIVEEREDRLFFMIEGGNEAILIGKRGQTLEAIQYLVEKILSQKGARKVFLQIDVGGYLKNRQENLVRQAARLAEKAKRIGKPVTMGHMNAYDRRIVHMSLKDDAEVKTQSIGEGFYRKLVILPKRAPLRKRTNDRDETAGEA